jgi:hypothetical protein
MGYNIPLLLLTSSTPTTSTGRLETYGQIDCYRDSFPHLITSLSVFKHSYPSAHHQDFNDRVECQGLLISAQVRATERVAAELIQLLPSEIPVAPLASKGLLAAWHYSATFTLRECLRFLGLPRSLGQGCTSPRLISNLSRG